MKFKVEITDELVEEIVREELKLAYELCNRPDHVDCSNTLLEPDQELLNALKIALKYFSAPKEYSEWIEKIESIDE